MRAAPLSADHEKSPDSSAPLSAVTVSALVTKVPVVVARPDNQTHPREFPFPQSPPPPPSPTPNPNLLSPQKQRAALSSGK